MEILLRHHGGLEYTQYSSQCDRKEQRHLRDFFVVRPLQINVLLLRLMLALVGRLVNELTDHTPGQTFSQRYSLHMLRS